MNFVETAASPQLAVSRTRSDQNSSPSPHIAPTKNRAPPSVANTLQMPKLELVEDLAELNLQLFPSFRPGVSYFRNRDDEIYVGFRHRGLAVISDAPEIDRVLELLDGSLSIAEILGRVEVSRLEIAKLITPLNGYNFIDLSPNRTRVKTNRELLSQSFINHEAKLKPELNLYSWANKHEPKKRAVGSKSARDQIADRAEFAILIFGKNRLATTLFTLFRASGFNRTKLITRSPGLLQRSQNGPLKLRKVSIDQVCGLGIRATDVGLDFDAVISDISSGSGINTLGQGNFANNADFPSIPSFIVSTERAQADYVQRWMSEGIPYLLISDLIESQIEIGPIVIPGQSPCAFCLELWRSENNPLIQKLELLNSLNDSLELPASAVATIAGQVVLQTSQFAATGKSRLIGSSVRINLLEPCYPESAYFLPHSGCGCIL